MAFTFEEFPNSDYYNSDLRKILKYMRTFKETLDEYAEVIETLEDAIEDIDDMQAAITALQTATSDLDTIRNNISALQSADEELQDEIDTITANVTALTTKYESLVDYIDAEDDLLALSIKSLKVELLVITNELDERITALENNIDTTTYNPWHDEAISKKGLRTNFRLAYADLADLVPLAMEYSELGLTADEYAEYELTAIEYALRGRKHLHLDWVFSPIYGWKQEISNVLTSIVNYFSGTITATEYAALDLDSDDYTSLDLTATEYLTYGATTGTVVIGGNGLTAAQYATLDTSV